ncbi:redox-regulated ATPase YchF [Riemerella anatipestifer]|uniref:Ribosome-binding ATPase YchF n=1 Tax=Riemerella anatipestifer (strain ATCC 11845 / DSM 15868 / JCM 9532 / NCTC 11014) TaxID=693978 RepID=E4TAZ8_RIEAD|nr:redox-regulated ATPase YchF [Riemerella anatipestifer]ADQ81234.1 GTP-binding protein YchF [Riemerella anatipestifer ATCC 11845 = DSM 15868]ADZ11283.1 Predicted GTPase, probable translation factor [Riemerella anatipestifer RA-GD]AFD55264.1 GTP-binding protein ychf [Riemerella anatipestifer ATCC 11845 = DSM 15868]AGC40878.1 putative GTPase, probable translation factor [Riemerella anatipestifer RA-CH-2]AKP70359.1 GTP-binding protein ychf [Riemerella anatipestifer]
MKCGIVGLPNVGKSTLFNCLSNAKAQSANYPFCTIEPNLGTVSVPDQRLFELEKLVNPERVLPAVVEIVDIAGLVKGASRGEGLGNQFLANIRECEAIIHVLRCFDNGNIVHVEGSVDPLRDKEIIDIELQLKDIETLTKAVEKAKKFIKSGKKEDVLKYETLKNILEFVESGRNAREFETDDITQLIIDEIQLLTKKPVLYLCNVDENSIKNGNEWISKVEEIAQKEGAEVLALAAQIEADINELETYEERQMFSEELGLEEPGVNRLIRKAYELLKLQTYFTAGVKEVRAWTIGKGWTAPQAAGVIHTDFEKGFIRAEVIKYEDFINYGSEAKVKEAGKLSVEGKEYVVQDGDIMHFRFNV